MQVLIRILTAAVLSMGLVSASCAAGGQKVLVGVNLVNNPVDLSEAEQESILKEMQAAGVRVIRTGLKGDDKEQAFLSRVYAHGMRIEMLINPVGKRTENSEAGATGAGLPRWVGLSTFDPALSKARFESTFAELDAAGLVLAGIEMGNEINGAGSNSDFPVPGEGRVLGEDDLKNDPEGKKVAQGYLQYIKILKILKEVRDHSKMNRQTPIISAGLVAAFEDTPISGKQDLVTFEGTLNFLRANGLDGVVDGYGVHFYPPAGNLGPAGSAKREGMLDSLLGQCRPAGAAGGKPCWMTEWGSRIGTTDTCPSPDGDRTKLVREMRGHFQKFAEQGRLKGLFFFTWQGFAGAAHEDRFSAFRCGELTESGRLAIAPM